MIFTADHEAGLETEIVSEGRPQAVRTAHRIARAKQDGGKPCSTAAARGAVESAEAENVQITSNRHAPRRPRNEGSAEEDRTSDRSEAVGHVSAERGAIRLFDLKQQADNNKSTGVSKCWRADADGNCEWSGKPCRMCASFVDEHDLKQQADNNKKATMKQPTYKMERIALADCKPHADAEAYSASSEDRAALSNSINESGLLSPIAVIPGEEAAPAAENGGGTVKGGKRTKARKTWYVIDGIGRLNALMAAGVTETDAQVFDLGDLSVAEFVVCKNAMMRKVTTGTRVMAYLKCHEREVLAAADPEKYARRKTSKWRNKVAAVSRDTAADDKGWASKDIAERIGVSNKDVLAGIELLKATAEAGDESAPAAENGGGTVPKYEQMDLFETAEAVLRGETPIRRWKAAAGGKVSKVGGKAAADYEAIAWRTVKSLKGVWENWQSIPMTARSNALGCFQSALKVIPEDFLALIEHELRLGPVVESKGKKRK